VASQTLHLCNSLLPRYIPSTHGVGELNHDVAASRAARQCLASHFAVSSRNSIQINRSVKIWNTRNTEFSPYSWPNSAQDDSAMPLIAQSKSLLGSGYNS